MKLSLDIYMENDKGVIEKVRTVEADSAFIPWKSAVTLVKAIDIKNISTLIKKATKAEMSDSKTTDELIDVLTTVVAQLIDEVSKILKATFREQRLTQEEIDNCNLADVVNVIFSMLMFVYSKTENPQKKS